jgi:GST-like protein
MDIDEWPAVKRWEAACAARPATNRGTAVLKDVMKIGNPDEETLASLFNQER